jgi:molecular chaperone GrpE
MSQDELETNSTPGAEAPQAEPVSQDASHLEDGYAGTLASDTARPPDAPAASNAPEQPSAAELEARLREELRAELAGELGALAELKDRVTGLEREVAAERERAGDYMRRWQQAQADLSNMKRRAQQEQEQLLTLAANQAAALVLPALDSLERAFGTLPEPLHQLTWVEGISLVEFQLRRVLESHGVAPFEPKPGDKLDPARHQPIAETATSEHPAGSVAQVVQRGYEMNGRVLRPALVAVAREPSPSAPTNSAGPKTEPHDIEPTASGP